MDQTNAVARPDSACEAAFEEVRRLRLSGDFPEAVDRLRALAEQHITNPTVVAKCFELMHRCRAPEAALELIGRARGVGTEKRTRGLRIVEADCLRATGQLRDACALVSDIDPDGVKGHYRAILDRVTAIELEPLPEDVESIAQAFENGEPRTGAVAFHALLDRCRGVAAPPPQHAIRDKESRRYAEAFAADDADDAPVVYLITDSIAMPREITGVGLEETYPWRLRAALNGVAAVRVNSRRQRTVRELPDLVQSAPDSACVVIQLGVVDSAPRVFSERDVDVVREVYGEAAVSMLIHLARQHRDHLLRDRHMSTYVPLPAFETLLRESVAQAQARAQAVALVTIVTPSRNGAKMYGAPLSVNIAEYNDAIARLARETGAALFDADGRLWSYPDAPLCFSGDNYHYNTLGHERCAEGLSELLRDLLGKAGV